MLMNFEAAEHNVVQTAKADADADDADADKVAVPAPAPAPASLPAPAPVLLNTIHASKENKAASVPVRAHRSGSGLKFICLMDGDPPQPML